MPQFPQLSNQGVRPASPAEVPQVAVRRIASRPASIELRVPAVTPGARRRLELRGIAGHAPRISAVILARNEADRIEACIRSVSFCDEVLVVDSLSTDGTAEIARRLGARVIERAWPCYRSQHEFAIARASHDGLLSIEAQS